MKAIGIILAGGKNERLKELTRNRATSAMPIGSCYRAIDFPLSNMTNSGISKVAVITQYNSRSLHDHLSSPKWWDLGSKQGGLFVFSPYLTSGNSLGFRGTADSIYQNLSFLRRSNEPYVVISSGDCVYKMDFNELVTYHEAKGADITIAYRKTPAHEDMSLYGVLQFDSEERLLDLEEKPLEPQSDLASIGIYIIKRELLIQLIETIISDGRYDIVRDLLQRYRKRLKIYGYRFTGYWRSLGSVPLYYECNMDFLKHDVRKLFKEKPYVKTKPKDEPPVKYNNTAKVINCLVGSGSIFDGNVNDSVIFRRVSVGSNAHVKNSIVLEGTKIERDCVIEYAIIDKEVSIKAGSKIIGKPDNLIIVPKNTNTL